MSSESKVGMKTLNKIIEIPVVSSTLDNATYYYNSVKELNSITRTTCNIGEFSCKTGLNIISPVVSICNKPSKFINIFFNFSYT